MLCLYKHMLGQVAELQDGTASVAVISPYKAQVGARSQAASLQRMMQCSWTLGSRTASSLLHLGQPAWGGPPA